MPWAAGGSDKEQSPAITYVASFPDPAGGRPISNGGAAYARWRGDGRELFYYAADGTDHGGAISETTKLEAGTPVPLFSVRMLGGPTMVTCFRAPYDVTADGQRFLMNVPVEDAADFPAITVGCGAEEVEVAVPATANRYQCARSSVDYSR